MTAKRNIRRCNRALTLWLNTGKEVKLEGVVQRTCRSLQVEFEENGDDGSSWTCSGRHLSVTVLELQAAARYWALWWSKRLVFESCRKTHSLFDAQPIAAPAPLPAAPLIINRNLSPSRSGVHLKDLICFQDEGTLQTTVFTPARQWTYFDSCPLQGARCPVVRTASFRMLCQFFGSRNRQTASLSDFARVCETFVRSEPVRKLSVGH